MSVVVRNEVGAILQLSKISEAFGAIRALSAIELPVVPAMSRA